MIFLQPWAKRFGTQWGVICSAHQKPTVYIGEGHVGLKPLQKCSNILRQIYRGACRHAGFKSVGLFATVSDKTFKKISIYESNWVCLKWRAGLLFELTWVNIIMIKLEPSLLLV
jgi:hypothetical protein